MLNLPRLGQVIIAGMLLVVAGCGTQAAPPRESASPPPEPGAKFDPAANGTLRGRVIWSGPALSQSDVIPPTVSQGRWVEMFRGKNVALPRIEENSKSMAGAVVYLKSVDAERSKPWDHSPPRVVMKDGFIRIDQDGSERAVGFAHVGQKVEMISQGPALEMLRARGSAFFTLPFPDAGKAVGRAFSRCGVVEFTSGAGNFWARGWLWVIDHPYIALTDDHGNFVLRDVPEGDYEVVCWMPSWRVQRRERDPEMMSVSRLYFHGAFEKSASAVVRRGETAEVEFTASLADFPNK